jgi:cyclase
MTDWITQIQKRGAGEILLNSMDADGSRAGYDIEMIKLARQHTTLPIIASGGAGSLSDFPKALAAGANALLAASVFHFGQFRISQVKAQLAKDNYPVRV